MMVLGIAEWSRTLTLLMFAHAQATDMAAHSFLCVGWGMVTSTNPFYSPKEGVQKWCVKNGLSQAGQ